MTNQFIKSPNQETEFTLREVQELKKCMRDPVYFMCNYVRVQHPKRGNVPFILYEFQKRLIAAINNPEKRWCIALLARQCGKTQVIAMYLLWIATFKSDQQILIASKNNSHAVEIMDRIRYAYEELPFWLKPGCITYNRHTIVFDNKSQIRSESTTEKTGRGLSVSILYLDELAFVRPSIQEEMWSSLAPTLSTGGFAIISSTPNGDTDLFANLWRGAEMDANGFLPFRAHWDEHPERGPEYLADMTRKLGETKMRQEILCVSGDTRVNINNGKQNKNMTIEEAYAYLLANQ